MALDSFMSENYKNLLEAAQRITKHSELSEELLHYALESFIVRRDCESIIESGGARYFIVRILLNQWNSSTSHFYNTYRKPSDSITSYLEESIADEMDFNVVETADKIQKILVNLSWYEQMLMDTYVQENHNISSLSRVTSIPRTSISLSINRIRKHIKSNL